MRIRILLSFVIAASLAGVLQSQVPSTNAPADSQNRGQFDVNVLTVPLMVSVTDNKGKSITNLTKEAFKIHEDDRLQVIQNFARNNDLPLSIALLVDSSGSVIDKIKFERDAATDFFFNTVKRKKDRAMVIGFDSTVSLLSDGTPDGFTDEPERLAEAVKKIKAGGGTSVFDAVYIAAHQKLSREIGERRKLIILISDGDDTASRLALKDALDAAQRNDVTIYAISTNKTSDTRSRDKVRGDDIIQELVDETGGKAYFPLKLDDLAVDFQKIGEELRSQYIVSYAPTNQNLDGTYRKVRVEMVDKKYKARTRNGYYASKGN
jgi:Ca-activated chloride channel homolog